MSDIIGIACVFGVTVSLMDLLSILDIEIESEYVNLQQVDDPLIKSRLPSGMSVFTHPDWEDMVILGSVIVTLDVDPSLTGSTLAPVITIPDVFDYTVYTEESPMYYQVPILNI
jgi:hypothetical protein